MRLRGNEKTVIALRVDDGLIAATRKAEVKKLIADLESEFKITAKEASYFFSDLKLRFSKMDQLRYAKKAIREYWNILEWRTVVHLLHQLLKNLGKLIHL